MRKFEHAPGSYKICGAHELGDLTSQGWHLVYSFQDSVAQSVREQVPNTQAPQQSYGPQTIELNKVVVVKTTMFALRKEPNEVLERLHEDLSQARKNVDHQYKLRTEGEEALKKKEELLVEAKRIVKEYSDKALRIGDERDQYQKQARLLEADIAKVRTAIGELKLKEILAPAEGKKP